MWPKEVSFENRSPFMQEAVPISSYTPCTRVTVWFHQCKLRSNDRYGSNFIRIAPKHNEVQKMGQLVGSPISEHVHWVYQLVKGCINYIKSSNIRRTGSQKLNVFRLVLRLSLPNPLKSRIKIQLEQRHQAMLQLHLSDQKFIAS